MAKSEITKFDEEWKTGDRAVARSIAAAYVNDHRSEFNHLDGLSIPELVEVVRTARTAGKEEDRIKADMFILVEVPPQMITGRISPGGGA